jgi:hypothetical protein
MTGLLWARAFVQVVLAAAVGLLVWAAWKDRA